MNWTNVQRAGYPCSVPDGQPGPKTWIALFAYAAGRQPDDVLRELGAAAAADLTNDPIAATPQRLAEFLAQTAHETGGYARFVESLAYDADDLMRQWPTHFTPALGSGLIGHSQKMTVAARATAAKKAVGQRS